jgi:hypothetical protein
VIAFGFAVAVGLPLFVLFAVLVWPEPTAHRAEAERETLGSTSR